MSENVESIFGRQNDLSVMPGTGRMAMSVDGGIIALSGGFTPHSRPANGGHGGVGVLGGSSVKCGA
jgi:hypothetical protein